MASPEFDLGGVRYRVKTLNAVDAWHLLVRLQPLLPSLWTLEGGLQNGADLKNVVAALAPLTGCSDEDLARIVQGTLAACERLEGETWVAAETAPPMAILLQLIAAVVAANYVEFFTMARASYKPVSFEGVTYAPASMPDNEDWLFRPLVSTPPLCTLRELQDGTYGLSDVARMNDLLDVHEENRRRLDKARSQKHV